MARSFLRTAAAAAVLAALLALGWGGGFFFGYRAASNRDVPGEVRAQEEEFARSMNGVALQGSFTAGTAGTAGTAEGAEAGGLSEESYTIESVEKLAGDLWLFRTRMKFGEREVTLPVPVRVLFAGDTPVVTLTDRSLPGLGAFTARVLFYRDRYAGLWWSSDASGHQFGRLVREP